MPRNLHLRSRLSHLGKPGLIGVGRSPLVGYAAAALGVCLMTGLVAEVSAFVAADNLYMLYLVIVIATAAGFGVGPSLVASILSVLAYDLFFVEPVGDLAPRDPDQWTGLLLSLLVALVIGQLAVELRRRAVEMERREQETHSLYVLTALIAQTNDPGQFLPPVLPLVGPELEIDGLALLAPGLDDQIEVVATAGRMEIDEAAQVRIAEDLFGSGRFGTAPAARPEPRGVATSAALGAGAVEVCGLLYLAVCSTDRLAGVLAIQRRAGAPTLTPHQARFLMAVTQQFGVALDRARLQAEAAAALALRQAEVVKDAVLKSITHDLRTPLALIKASAGNLREGDVSWSEPERRRFAVMIERNIDRLDAIVGNLLDLTRIEAGMLDAERQYYPIADLIYEALERLHPLLESHPVTVEAPDDLPLVLIDYVAIDRVLGNLVENAVHYTAAGTQIAVAAMRGPGAVVVSVADEGPGISPADLPRLFDRFYRGEPARASAPRGAGLGLAVAKGLVEAHGGIIRVENRPEGGARFTFSLPVDAAGASMPLADAGESG